ncbi:hypothetical protein XELAEV_18019831mg [Xenopus laevis]|uniref:Uncharacterized protein n=1 Tax=Xenopus laevis TaxID=8355 RepID=A0A974D6J7_XENLA|nr:hypothetical protein XELAEV_18019831mg [Xenopus laevis]
MCSISSPIVLGISVLFAQQIAPVFSLQDISPLSVFLWFVEAAILDVQMCVCVCSVIHSSTMKRHFLHLSNSKGGQSKRSPNEPDLSPKMATKSSG